MENLSISHVFTSRLELVDSRSVNVFEDKLDIFVENIHFHIMFIEDKKETAGADIEKTDPESFDITLYNLQDGGIRGVHKPLDFGVIDGVYYSFSISGIANKNNEYKTVVFNLYKDIKYES